MVDEESEFPKLPLAVGGDPALQNHAAADLPPLPPRWRSVLPEWIRSLLWVDQASSFDAFISYSWKADAEFSPILQSVLQKFLCPWYKVRALNIFRDLSALAANEDLETSLREKLDKSTHLIVLASQQARISRGMDFELTYWLSKPRRGQILVVATSGPNGNWAAVRENAIPPALKLGLLTTPLWIDISKRKAPVSRVDFVSGADLLRTLGGRPDIHISQDPVKIPKLIYQACSKLERNLTTEEWKAFLGDSHYEKTCDSLGAPLASKAIAKTMQ
jgi:hypothetical protein